MDLNNTQSNIPELNLSDIVDAIEEDARTKTVQQMDAPSSNNGRRPTTLPYIKIVEQPASKALRFRYKCESRLAGSIPGVNSSTENKTYPTIQIVGYKGRAVVEVSCVTKDRPYRPHPHNLVGRDNCKNGICSIEINNESMTESFQNLGIQCVKRKDIDKALRVREEIKLDPFKTGFSHKENPTSIDLNAVRLCFQAYLGGTQKRKCCILEPIVSDPIYDKKAMSDLSICRLSDAAASVVGDKEIILLCNKVTKDDIQVRFFEENDGKCIWEDYGVFKASDVHKQVAIWFKTPKYYITEIDSPVNVWIQLKRPSDGMCSDALPFTFTPDNSDPVMLKRKRQKLPTESELLIQLSRNPIRIKTSGCNITKVCPTVNSHDPTSQKNYALPTTITTTPLPCPTEDNNESNLMEATFPSLCSSDLRTLLGDSEHVFSTNLSASLHLTENSARGESIPEIVAEDNINIFDGYDGITDSVFKDFYELYTKSN